MARLARDGWTIAEASADFTSTGLPIPPRQLAMVIRALPGFTRIGEKPSGRLGGRGETLYDIGQLQRLHAALSPWLAGDLPSGSTDLPSGTQDLPTQLPSP